MGAIVAQPIRCTNCSHKKAIAYSSGILYCWHCKNHWRITK